MVKNPSANAGDPVRSLGQEDPLEKEMATHSIVLVWEIHGQRSLMGCSPCCCRRVGHNLVTQRHQEVLISRLSINGEVRKY